MQRTEESHARCIKHRSMHLHSVHTVHPFPLAAQSFGTPCRSLALFERHTHEERRNERRKVQRKAEGKIDREDIEERLLQTQTKVSTLTRL